MPAIYSYKVGISRAVKGGPVRWMTVQFDEPAGALRQGSLFFYEKEAPNLGHLNHKAGCVVINLPLVDFESTYQVLNTEKPVFLHWRTDPEDDKLIGIDLSTSEEPLGEGTPDRSP